MITQMDPTIRHRIFAVGFVFLVVVFLLSSWIVSSQRTESSKEMVENVQQDDPETQELLRVLADRRAAELSTESTAAAILQLGAIGNSCSIPTLVTYLDFERKFQPRAGANPNVIEHWDSIALSRRYPAVEALIRIGRPVLPAVTETIEREATESIKSANAVYIFQQIFRDDLLLGVEYLEKAAKKSKSTPARKRLDEAISDLRQLELKSKN